MRQWDSSTVPVAVVIVIVSAEEDVWSFHFHSNYKLEATATAEHKLSRSEICRETCAIVSCRQRLMKMSFDLCFADGLLL